MVVDGIDEPIAKALLGLDGTRTEAEVLAAAAETGLDPDLVGDLLTDLRTAGVLAEVTPRPAGPGPAAAPGAGPVVMASWPRTSAYGAVGAAGRLGPDLASLSLVPAPRTPLEVVRGRRAASVVVHGAGRVGVSLATLLAAAGVGQVHVADRGPVRPGDVAPAGVAAADVDRSRSRGRGRGAAPGRARGAVRRRRRPAAGPTWSCWPRPSRSTRRCAPRWPAAASPHLVAGVRETTAVVGPLVLPGPHRLPALRRPAPGRPRPGLAGRRRPAGRDPPPAGGAVRRGVGHSGRRASPRCSAWPTSTAGRPPRPAPAWS